jgi:hypothetical protein
VPYGTHGLLIQVSLVSDPAVFDRSTEPFTVPENGSNYYVNDASTANDQYTTAAGSNRNDGKLPSQPLPNIDNVLRQYSLTSGSVIYVDPGSYPMIDPFDVSGNLNYGLGLDQGFTVQGPTNGTAAILMPAIPGNPVNLIQLEDANFVTINNLTLQNAGRGLYVQGSSGFSSTGVTVTGMAYEGVRIDTGSSVTLLKNPIVTNSGLAGIYINGTVGAISNANVTDSGLTVSTYQAGNPGLASGLYVVGPVAAVSGTFANNIGWGIYLSNPGAVDVTNSTIFGNLDGLYVDGNNGTAIIGDTVLTNNAGNVIHDNAGYGIVATGSVLVAGNVVYNESGASSFGIEVQNGGTATENVVYASRIGIVDDDAKLISANRVYDNALIGIEIIDDIYSGAGIAITGNVVYSNGSGIIDEPNYYNNGSVTINNNLIYANATVAIALDGTAESRSSTTRSINWPAMASTSPTATAAPRHATTSW